MMRASIVIPFHNRPNTAGNFELVLRCLKSAIDFPIPTDYIPDSNIASFCSYTDSVELLIVTDRAVLPAMRHNVLAKVNVGIKQATGDVLVLLDQDVLSVEDSILAMIKHSEEQPEAMIYAKMQKYLENGYLVDWVSPGSEQPSNMFLACNRKRLIEAGGFDEDFAEGWGWEDLMSGFWFNKRFDKQYVHFASGMHLYHQPPSDVAMQKNYHNSQLWLAKKEDPDYFPNKGKEWGVLYISS